MKRLVVVWRVTDRCNLSCGFCAQDSRLPIERPSARAETVLAFGRTLADYTQLTGSPTHLSLLGGEPFLWQPLHSVESELSARGLSLGITTNGTTLGSPLVRARLLAHYDETTVSVDGIGTTHDELRGHRDGFRALRQGTRKLIEARKHQTPRVRVNTVLMRETIAQFGALCHELADWGVDEITFNELGGRDRPEFHAAHRLGAQDVGKFAAELGDLRRDLASRGVLLRGDSRYTERMRASALDVPWPVNECSAGERFLFVEVDGKLAPCNFTAGEYGVRVEQIGNVEALLDLPQRFAAARRTRRSASCDDCRSTQVFDKFSSPLVPTGNLTKQPGAVVDGT